MRRGPIFILMNWLINLLHKINPAELFKSLIAWISPYKELERTFKSNAIDLFIFFKWSVLVLIPLFGINAFFSLVILVTLLFFNVFTYFYHHVWDSKCDGSKESAQRRFISFTQAVAYNVFVFAFFYKYIFYTNFTWTYKEFGLSPLIYSLATTVAASTQIAVPNSATGEVLTTIQTLTSFIFLTLILSHTAIAGEKK